MDEFILSVVCLNEAAWRGSDAMRFARTSTRGLLKALEGNDRGLILSEVEKLRKRTKEFFKDYDPKVDADLFLSTMKSFVEIAPKEHYLEYLLKT